MMDNFQLDRDQRKHLRLEALHGNELVAVVARLAAMNLRHHGVGPLKAEEGKLPITIGDSLASHGTTRYDVVLTNPPFGKQSTIIRTVK